MLMRLPSRPGSAECDSSRLEKGAVPGRARMQRWLHAAQRGPAALGEGRNVLASAESSPSKSLAAADLAEGTSTPLACLQSEPHWSVGVVCLTRLLHLVLAAASSRSRAC